jgi:hypothetical protein
MTSDKRVLMGGGDVQGTDAEEVTVNGDHKSSHLSRRFTVAMQNVHMPAYDVADFVFHLRNS